VAALEGPGGRPRAGPARSARGGLKGAGASRKGAAEPHKDGKQTPYRGHPVFVAQHATGTCCRTCLERNHEIPQGRPLGEDERDYVVDVICRWIERECAVA
jgi:hypothetical protein